MKSLRILASLILIVTASIAISAQGNRNVRGNGNVIKKERTAPAFTGVKVGTAIDVYLTQGNNNSIVVEADENLHEYIITEVRGGVLTIYYDNVSIREVTMSRVHVTLKDITSLETTSAGDIIGQTPLKCGDIEIGTSSAGDIKVELTAANVEVDISSAGDVTLSGTANRLEADLSSAGELEASDLKVKEAEVSVSSAGSASIYVSERLEARASSAGDIRYYGDPKYVDSHASSAGSIRKR